MTTPALDFDPAFKTTEELAAYLNQILKILEGRADEARNVLQSRISQLSQLSAECHEKQTTSAELERQILDKRETVRALEERHRELLRLITEQVAQYEKLEFQSKQKRIDLAELQALIRGHGPRPEANEMMERLKDPHWVPDLPESELPAGALPDLSAAAAAVAEAEDGTGPLYQAIERIVNGFLEKKGISQAS